MLSPPVYSLIGVQLEWPSSNGAIRSVDVADEQAYIGDADGRLHWYKIYADGWLLEHSVHLSRSRPVERVVVLKSVGLVLTLCGVCVLTELNVSFFRYPSLSPTSLAPIRGVVGVVLDDAGTSEGYVSLCLLRKRSISVYMVEPNAWGPVCDIPLSRGAVIARRFNEIVCLATPTDYAVLNLDTGEQTHIGLPISQATSEPSAQVRPSIIPLEDSGSCCFLITSHSENGTFGAFVRPNGEPVDRLLEWIVHPRALALDPPFLCALLRNDTLVIHNIHSLEHIQTIEAPRSARSLQGIPPICGNDFTEPARVLLHGKHELHMLVRASKQGLAVELAQQGKLSRASVLLGECDDSIATSRAAWSLALVHIRNARFTVAAPLVVRAGLDPRDLLSRFERFRALVPGPSALTQIDTVEGIVRNNLSLNYPTLSGDPAVAELSASLLERAYAMLVAVIERADDGASQSALLELALERNPTAPAHTVERYLYRCLPSSCEILARHGRHFLLARLYERLGRKEEALDLYVRVYDQVITDVDSVPLAHIATLSQAMNDAQRGLWVAKHDSVLGTRVLTEIDLGGDVLPTLDALAAIDGRAADGLLEYTAIKRGAIYLHNRLFTRLAAQREEVEFNGDGTFAEHAARGSPTRLKLSLLAEYSRGIDLRAAIAEFNSGSFAYERAIVLARLGEFKGALDILVLELNDTFSAETLCKHARVLPLEDAVRLARETHIDMYESLVWPNRCADAVQRESLTRYLCDVYLDNTGYREPARRLINGNPSLFDPMHIIDKIPPSWPVSDLYEFIHQALYRQGVRLREAQSVKALAYAQNIAASESQWRIVRYVIANSSMGGVLEENTEVPQETTNHQRDTGARLSLPSDEKDDARTDEK